MNKVCPCRYCVAPKRYPGCAANCPDWADWQKVEDQRRAKLREAYNDMYLGIPSGILYPKKSRRK